MKTITQEELIELVKRHSNWLNSKANWERLVLSGYDISNLDFSDMDLRDAVFIGAETDGKKYVNFYGANLRGADFSNSQLKRCIFTGANLTETYFDNARLTCCHFDNSNLRYTRFYNTYLTNNAISYANFQYTDFRACKRNGFIVNREPIKITGLLPHPILIFETHIEISSNHYSAERWESFTEEDFNKMSISYMWEQWNANKAMIIGIANQRDKIETFIITA